MNQNGKGSRPRSGYNEKYRNNYDQIQWSDTLRDDIRLTIRQAYRLIAEPGGTWYLIRDDEVQIFQHWVAAMEGKRHMPSHFEPILVRDPENIRIYDWEIVS